MSEFAWNTEVAEEAQQQPETQSEPDGQPASEPAAQESAGEREAVTLSANEFSALEERIVRAVEVVRRERHARTAAEERAGQAEARATGAEERAAGAEERAARADERANGVEGQLREQVQHLEQLEKEIGALRSERDQVRQRVERLLGQLDALEL
jgi:chromosome segregation ATPase